MAMDAGDCVDGTGLAGLIAKYMKDDNPKFKAEDAASMVNPLAKAIVEHIQNNAEVVAEATDVTTGGDTAPVAGTVT